jgi:hypothetical protein
MNGGRATKSRSQLKKMSNTTSLWTVLDEDGPDEQSIDHPAAYACDHSYPAACPPREGVLGSFIDRLAHAGNNGNRMQDTHGQLRADEHQYEESSDIKQEQPQCSPDNLLRSSH